MEIHIKGHESISGLLKEQYRKFDVVLYTNSKYPIPRFIETHAKNLLHLAVDDVGTRKPRSKLVAPNLNTVQTFLDWTKDREKLIICCHAGVSRSSSTAYVIASREYGPEEAIKMLKPQKHWPNRRIVWFGSVALNNPAIWDIFVQWQTKENGLDPSKDFVP